MDPEVDSAVTRQAADSTEDIELSDLGSEMSDVGSSILGAESDSEDEDVVVVPMEHGKSRYQYYHSIAMTIPVVALIAQIYRRWLCPVVNVVKVVLYRLYRICRPLLRFFAALCCVPLIKKSKYWRDTQERCSENMPKGVGRLLFDIVSFYAVLRLSWDFIKPSRPVTFGFDLPLSWANPTIRELEPLPADAKWYNNAVTPRPMRKYFKMDEEKTSILADAACADRDCWDGNAIKQISLPKNFSTGEPYNAVENGVDYVICFCYAQVKSSGLGKNQWVAEEFVFPRFERPEGAGPLDDPLPTSPKAEWAKKRAEEIGLEEVEGLLLPNGERPNIVLFLIDAATETMAHQELTKAMETVEKRGHSENLWFNYHNIVSRKSIGNQPPFYFGLDATQSISTFPRVNGDGSGLLSGEQDLSGYKCEYDNLFVSAALRGYRTAAHYDVKFQAEEYRWTHLHIAGPDGNWENLRKQLTSLCNGTCTRTEAMEEATVPPKFASVYSRVAVRSALSTSSVSKQRQFNAYKVWPTDISNEALVDGVTSVLLDGDRARRAARAQGVNASEISPVFSSLYTYGAHWDLGVPNWIEGRMAQPIEKMFNELPESVLNSTIFLFFSDHGPHYGFHSIHVEGARHHKHPFMWFVMPKVLMESNPDVAKALRANRDVITTPFDAHRTLRHIMNYPSNPAPVFPAAKSLLEPIATSRTCPEAGIPPEWCMWQEWVFFDLPAADKSYLPGVPASTLVNVFNNALDVVANEPIAAYNAKQKASGGSPTGCQPLTLFFWQEGRMTCPHDPETCKRPPSLMFWLRAVTTAKTRPLFAQMEVTAVVDVDWTATARAATLAGLDLDDLDNIPADVVRLAPKWELLSVYRRSRMHYDEVHPSDLPDGMSDVFCRRTVPI